MNPKLEEKFRQRAVELGNAGDPAALPELIQLAQAPAANVRRLAASAIGKLAGLAHPLQAEFNKAYIAHFRKSDQCTQSVGEHLFETSDISMHLAGKIQLRNFGNLLGLLHDFGKYGKKCNSYIKSATGLLLPESPTYLDPLKFKGKIDHSTAGAQWVWNQMKVPDPILCLAKEILALCIVSHHGGLIDCIDVDGTDLLNKRISKSTDKTHYDSACERADAVTLREAKKVLTNLVSSTELNAIVLQINQNTASVTLRMLWLGIIVRFLFSCLIDADRLNTADFENPENKKVRSYGQYAHWTTLISCFEKHIAHFSSDSIINKKRTAISISCLQKSAKNSGLFYLTVPTGGGKTLASMRFALHHAEEHKMDRIIYVIPYTSIIEQNAQEIRNIFSKNNAFDVNEIILEHHSNLQDKQDTKYSRLLSENWDAPIVFTTMVQLLEALFGGGTKGARRMHQLARSVIIFDEIQTLPIKTVHLFNNAINVLTSIFRSTVIFCTATQPLLHAVDRSKGAVPYDISMEIIPDRSLFDGFRRIEVIDRCRPEGWSDVDIKREIQTQLSELGSVLLIANTKKAAKRIYAETDGLCKCRYHLSTSMCPAHRLEVLRHIKIALKFGLPVVCISTQLVEAGVNLDFGCVFRSLAGLDSIAQAAGRGNRNNRRSFGRVIIINIKKENLDKLYEIRMAQIEARRVLTEYHRDPSAFDNSLISPKAIERYYQYFFYQRAAEMNYPVHVSDAGKDDNLLNMLSTNAKAYEESRRTGKNVNKNRILMQAFHSAGQFFEVIDAPTLGILVHYEGQRKIKDEASRIIRQLTIVKDISEQKRLMKQAQRYSVNIFPSDLLKLDQAKALHETQPGSGIWYLAKEYYSPEYGVATEAVGEMEFEHI